MTVGHLSFPSTLTPPALGKAEMNQGRNTRLEGESLQICVTYDKEVFGD